MSKRKQRVEEAEEEGWREEAEKKGGGGEESDGGAGRLSSSKIVSETRRANEKQEVKHRISDDKVVRLLTPLANTGSTEPQPRPLSPTLTVFPTRTLV